jgi:hypothetical protein
MNLFFLGSRMTIQSFLLMAIGHRVVSDNKLVPSKPQEFRQPAGLLPGRAALHKDDGVRTAHSTSISTVNACIAWSSISQLYTYYRYVQENQHWWSVGRSVCLCSQRRRPPGLADAPPRGRGRGLLPGAHAPAQPAGDRPHAGHLDDLPHRRLRRQDLRRVLLRRAPGRDGGDRREPVPGPVGQGERRVQLRHGAAGDHGRPLHGVGGRPAGGLGGELPPRGAAAQGRHGPQPEEVLQCADRRQARRRHQGLHRPGAEAAADHAGGREAAQGDHRHASGRCHSQGVAAVVGRAGDHLHRGELRASSEGC